MTRSHKQFLWDLCSIAAAVIVLALFVLLVPRVMGAEPPAPRDSDLKLRARAAVALAEAEAAARKGAVATAARPHVAPAPRASAKLAYPAAYKLAAEEQLPLVVFVGCDGAKPAGAVASKADSLGDVAGPAVVVAFPVGDRLHVDSTIPAGEATAERVRAAVDAAAKKLEAPPRLMPARKSLPVPPDYQIRGGDAPDRVPAYPREVAQVAKGGCICGTECKCAANSCPGKCPVAAKPQPKAPESDVIVTASGRKIRKVGNGYVYADEDKQPKGVSRPQATPFPPAPATILTTPATNVAIPSSLSSGSYRPAATFTPAGRAATPGSTNCAPGQA